MKLANTKRIKKDPNIYYNNKPPYPRMPINQLCLDVTTLYSGIQMYARRLRKPC